MAVPAVESSWLLDGVWTGRAALLCHGLRGNPGGMTMGGLSGLLWGPTVLLCPIWPRGDGRSGCPIASPHLGVGNSSTEGALFLLNE